MMAGELVFDTDFSPQPDAAVEIAPGIQRLVAPNASPYTFTGTNTYVIGSGPVFILDPGPDVDAHHDALVQTVAGHAVTAILLTHTHRDHSALAARLSQSLDAPLWFGGQHRLSRPLRRFEVNVLSGSCDWTLKPDRVLHDGEVISAGGIDLEIVATPGHCANHLSFGVVGESVLFSGDHVMGWNSTLVAKPDGDMSAYLTSLDRLIGSEWVHYLPGHGGSIEDGRAYAEALKSHREMRNHQIVEAANSGVTRVGGIVAQLYPDVPLVTQKAAAMTVMAHIEHLARAGQLDLKWRWGRARVAPV